MRSVKRHTCARSVGAALCLLAATLGGSATATAPTQVAVSGPRISIGDLVPSASSEVASIDVGASPSVGGSRVYDRKELERIVTEHGQEPPRGLPEAVRVVRKTVRLDAEALERLTRDAFTEGGTPRGTTLAAVHAPRSVDVADGWNHATAEVPRPPRRTGPFTTTATLSLLRDAEVIARISVPIELTLGAEAGTFEVPHGSPVTLVVRRGLVEVSIGGTTGADADVGGMVTVILHPSGRAIPARLSDKDHAVSLQGL